MENSSKIITNLARILLDSVQPVTAIGPLEQPEKSTDHTDISPYSLTSEQQPTAPNLVKRNICQVVLYNKKNDVKYLMTKRRFPGETVSGLQETNPKCPVRLRSRSFSGGNFTWPRHRHRQPNFMTKLTPRNGYTKYSDVFNGKTTINKILNYTFKFIFINVFKSISKCPHKNFSHKVFFV